MRKINFKFLVAFLFFGVLLAMAGLRTQTDFAATPEKISPLQSITFDAVLIDMAQKGAKKSATVEVKVSGIELVDPDKVYEKAQDGQGHLHYRLDDGPIIATISPKLSFHELSSGSHKIVVGLAANDHKPLGPQKTLEVKIP
jgi:hypothetical protein